MYVTLVAAGQVRQIPGGQAVVVHAHQTWATIDANCAASSTVMMLTLGGHGVFVMVMMAVKMVERLAVILVVMMAVLGSDQGTWIHDGQVDAAHADPAQASHGGRSAWMWRVMRSHEGHWNE